MELLLCRYNDTGLFKCRSLPSCSCHSDMSEENIERSGDRETSSRNKNQMNDRVHCLPFFQHLNINGRPLWRALWDESGARTASDTEGACSVSQQCEESPSTYAEVSLTEYGSRIGLCQLEHLQARLSRFSNGYGRVRSSTLMKRKKLERRHWRWMLMSMLLQCWSHYRQLLQ